jgi:hypothetical protein
VKSKRLLKIDIDARSKHILVVVIFLIFILFILFLEQKMLLILVSHILDTELVNNLTQNAHFFTALYLFLSLPLCQTQTYLLIVLVIWMLYTRTGLRYRH